MTVSWTRQTAHDGREYGPAYARNPSGSIVGSVTQCVGDKSHLWLANVRPTANGWLSCYAWSERRARYFVERWTAAHLQIANAKKRPQP